MSLPRACTEGLIIQERPEATLLYDPRTQRAHCLAPAAAQVWRRCDGRTTVAQIADALRREAGVPADERLVGAALEQLRHIDLVQASPLPEPSV
jgi:hypothetical protein